MAATDIPEVSSQASASKPVLRSATSSESVTTAEILTDKHKASRGTDLERVLTLPEREVKVEPVPSRDVSIDMPPWRKPLDIKSVDGNLKRRMIPAKSHIQSTGPMAGRWEPCVHPSEGGLYFRWENFYTNVYLYDEDSLNCIDAAVAKLLDKIREHPEIVLEGIEAGLCLVDDKKDYVGGYYLADKVKEEVFWLEDVDEGFMNDSKVVSILDQGHMTFIAQHCYWDHVYMFPHGRQYSLDQFAKFQAELNYWMFDKGLSLQSNLPYSTEEIDIFKRILKDIPSVKLSTKETTPTRYVIVLAKLNSRLAYTRFIRYHEQHKRSVDDTGSSLWLKIIFWLLFTPPTYTERLRDFSMDSVIASISRWSTFVTDLREDWANSMTPTTVILATNVGFLAIQSVDKDQANRSAGQIISYISLILSIGNIFACVILGGILHRSLTQSSPDALEYLFEHLGTDAGRKKIAIILSIPTAFFLWGLLTFLMSIIWMCFYDTGITTRLVVSFTIVVSAYLIGTAFYMGHRPQALFYTYFVLSTKLRYTYFVLSTKLRYTYIELRFMWWRVRRVGRKIIGMMHKDTPSHSNHQSPPANTNGDGDGAPEPDSDQGTEIGKNSHRSSSDAVTTGVLPHLTPKPSPTSTDSSTPNPLGSTDGALQVAGSEDGGETRETKRSSVEEMV